MCLELKIATHDTHNMKQALRIPLTSITIICAPLAFFAAQEGFSETNNYDSPDNTVEEFLSLPQPVHHPVPAVNKHLIGTTVKLNFIVNEYGNPEAVKLGKPLYQYRHETMINFASQLRAHVVNWQFDPALNQTGNSVSAKVIMPIQIVKKDGRSTALVSLIPDDRERSL